MCTGGSQKRIDGPHSMKYSSAADLATQIRLKKMNGSETVQIKKREWKLKRFDDYISGKTVYGNILAERTEEYGEKIDLSFLQDDFQGYIIQRRMDR